MSLKGTLDILLSLRLYYCIVWSGHTWTIAIQISKSAKGAAMRSCLIDEFSNMPYHVGGHVGVAAHFAIPAVITEWLFSINWVFRVYRGYTDSYG